jgi:hypothetical protein
MCRFVDIVENNTESVFVDPVRVDSTRKMSLTFLLKTCLYGMCIAGSKEGWKRIRKCCIRKTKRLTTTAVKKRKDKFIEAVVHGKNSNGLSFFR